MRSLALFTLLFISRTLFAQTVQEQKLHYPVIVSISAAGEERTVEAVKKLAGKRSSGVSYLAYCNRQKCLILLADKARFVQSEQVLTCLDSLCPRRILAIKDQTIEQFYKQCSFADPEEYEYFKKNYGK